MMSTSMTPSRVADPESLCVKGNSGDERGGVSVSAIAENRMPDLREMDADLVLAPRLQANLDEDRPLETLDHSEVGHSPFPGPAQGGRANGERFAVLHEPGLNGPRIPRQGPFHDRDVLAPGLPRLELRRERLEGSRGLGEDQESRGMPVEAVDDEELRFAEPSFLE